MSLKSIAPNQTELTLSNGTVIFYSYNTPVACFISGQGYFKTEKKHSVTTSKHINAWIGRKDVPTKEQSFFDSLA